MKIIKQISVILFLALFSSISAFSQLQVTANSNASQLAQTLAGTGVIISGATLNCPGTNPSGTFVGTASNIGITGGVLLTSGSINNAVGPNSSGSAGTSNSVTYSDPDLISISPFALNDVCILEFNAVPSCSTLAFTFAFGSDEYPEYVNSINDAFGIFVTGPNPSGPAYAGYNMALIPSTTSPVTIDDVNNGSSCPTSGPCTNCSSYIDNCNLSPTSTIEYDGFTKPINVTLNVSPCASYHFKLAIADASDNVFDSGVFFAMQSLACNPLPILLSTTSTPATCGNSGSASVAPAGGTPPYSYSWNTMPVQNTQTATGLVAGTYTVLVQDATGCYSNTGTVTVGGGGSFSVTATKTDVTCNGGSNGAAAATTTGGTTPFTYIWSTTPVQTSPNAVNLSAGTYTCTITDATGCTSIQPFTIAQPAAITITNTSANVTCAYYNDGSSTASAGGGTSPYTYSWNTSPVQSSPTANNLVAGNYVVTVTDAKGCTNTQAVVITQPSGMVLTSSSTIASCGIADGTATVSSTGGIPPYTYIWLTNPVQTTQTASNITSGTYSVIITDSAGCLQSENVGVQGTPFPVADFNIGSEVVSLLNPVVLFADASSGTITSWEWNFGDVNSVSDSSYLQNPTHTYSDTGAYCVTLQISNATAFCSDTMVKCLKVEAPHIFYIPNTFTPNQDGKNEIFLGYGAYVEKFQMYIFDRWGNLMFESNDINKGWNGSVNNDSATVQEDVYVWKVNIVASNKKDYKYVGLVNLIR